MLSYIDSARAGALDAGHAYAAGGRRAPEAENGVLMGGTKADASQRFDDFPGEQPSQCKIERSATARGPAGATIHRAAAQCQRGH